MVAATWLRVNPRELATARSWRRLRAATSNEWVAPPSPSAQSANASSRGTDPISPEIGDTRGRHHGLPTEFGKSPTSIIVSVTEPKVGPLGGLSVERLHALQAVGSDNEPLVGLVAVCEATDSGHDVLLITLVAGGNGDRFTDVDTELIGERRPKDGIAGGGGRLPRSRNGPIEPRTGSNAPGEREPAPLRTR